MICYMNSTGLVTTTQETGGMKHKGNHDYQNLSEICWGNILRQWQSCQARWRSNWLSYCSEHLLLWERILESWWVPADICHTETQSMMNSLLSVGERTENYWERGEVWWRLCVEAKADWLLTSWQAQALERGIKIEKDKNSYFVVW